MTTEKPSTTVERPEKKQAAPVVVEHALEQVREILFGAVQRELEQALARAASDVDARFHEIEQELRRRTGVLEAHVKRESEILAARIERQLAEQQDALRKLSDDQRAASNATDRRIGKVEENDAAALRDLRQQLLDQAKSFFDEMQTLRKEMLATFQRELALAEGEIVEERDGRKATSPH